MTICCKIKNYFEEIFGTQKMCRFQLNKQKKKIEKYLKYIFVESFLLYPIMCRVRARARVRVDYRERHRGRRAVRGGGRDNNII